MIHPIDKQLKDRTVKKMEEKKWYIHRISRIKRKSQSMFELQQKIYFYTQHHLSRWFCGSTCLLSLQSLG